MQDAQNDTPLKPSERVRNLVRKGLKGNSGRLPLMYLPDTDRKSRFSNDFVFGKGVFASIGGQGGSGKTAWTDSYLILNPIINWILKEKPKPRAQRKPKPVYQIYKTERPLDFMMAKWLGYLVQALDESEIPPVLSVNKLAGWQDTKVSTPEMEIMAKYTALLDEIVENHCTIHAASVYHDENGIIRHKSGHPYVEEMRDSLMTLPIPTHEDGSLMLEHEYIQTVTVDHAQNTATASGMGEKEKLDYHCDTLIMLRDARDFCCIDLVQWNRANENVLRSAGEFIPQKQDWYGSSRWSMHCDIMIGLVNPLTYRNHKYQGIHMDDYTDANNNLLIRFGHIVKNSYGPVDVSFPFGFIGQNGYAFDMPRDLEEHQINMIKEGRTRALLKSLI